MFCRGPWAGNPDVQARQTAGSELALREATWTADVLLSNLWLHNQGSRPNLPSGGNGCSKRVRWALRRSAEPARPVWIRAARAPVSSAEADATAAGISGLDKLDQRARPAGARQARPPGLPQRGSRQADQWAHYPVSHGFQCGRGHPPARVGHRHFRAREAARARPQDRPASCTGSATSPTTPRASLRQELGPEFADLQLSDLNPKAFVAKHLGPDATDELNYVADEMRGARTSLDGAIAASPDR